MTTEVLDLPEMTAGQGQKEITYNTALREIEAKLVRANEIRSAEPGSPTNGDIYILGPAPSGAEWGGRNENDIAHYYNNQWWFYVPQEGWRLWVMDQDIVYAFNGSAWIGTGATFDPTTDQTFTGTFLHLDRSTAGNATIRARGNSSGAGIIRAEGDNGFDVGILETRDFGSSNVWRLRHTGSDAGTRPDYLTLLYSPNDGGNFHEVFRAKPNQSTINNDPTDIEIQGNLEIARDHSVINRGHFTTEGDALRESVMMRGITTTGTSQELFIDGVGKRYIINNDVTVMVNAYIIGRRTDSPNESAGFVLTGLIDREAGVSTAIGSGFTSYRGVGTSETWTVNLGSDDAIDAVTINVTGQPGATIRWVAAVAFTLVEA